MKTIETESEAEGFVRSLGDAEAFDRLRVLVADLALENQHQNLIAGTTLASVWHRHIADSAQLIEISGDCARGTWLDLGTGAGFPGLVIAALRPDLLVTLVESRRRRIDWLGQCVDRLALSNCRVFGGRLEALDSFPADVISARAFAPLDKTIKLARRFSTKHTRWLLPKGRSAAQEVEGLPKNLRGLFHVEQSRTDADAGIVVGRGLE